MNILSESSLRFLGEEFLKVRARVAEKEVTKNEKHVIDLDADPLVPEGWKVENHRRSGKIKWSPLKIILYLTESQERDVINGHALRRELANVPVANANLLDFLLVNQHLIPEEWKDVVIVFWGTIYRDPEDRLRVRFLIQFDGQWNSEFFCLDDEDVSFNPAARLVS